MKTIIVLFVLFLLTGDLLASRPEIDSTAYATWKRIDDYKISVNGRWIKYRYVYVDNEEQNDIISKKYYFYNTYTGKSQIVEGTEYPEFFANGNWIHYTVESEDYENRTIYLMDLNKKRKIRWPYAQEPSYSSKTALVNYEAQDGNRVFLRLNTSDSVVYSNMVNYRLLNNDQNILYIWKGDKYCELRYGKLFVPSKYQLIFKDTTNSLKRFDLEKDYGYFELKSENNIQVWRFDLAGKVCLLTDSRTWAVPDSLVGRVRNIRMVGNGTIWEFDIYPKVTIAKKNSKKSQLDKSFELELWSWNDPIIQSEQAKSGFRTPSAKPDKYIYDTRTRKCCKVGDGFYSGFSFQPIDVPEFALLTDNSAFLKQKDWRNNERRDYLLVDLQTGCVRKFAQEQTQRAAWSLDGKYLVFYDDAKQAWFRLEPKEFVLENISSAIGYPIYDELCDRPHPAEPYGLPGWSPDGRYAYIYDRFDIWRVDMQDLSKSSCITKGIGRNEGMVLRFMNINYSDCLKIDESESQLVEMLEWKTRNQGIGRILPNGKLKKDFMGTCLLKASGISEDGNKIVFSRQSFVEGRNVWVYDVPSCKMKRVSDANPDHNGYQWGSVKMLEWTNGAGKSNQGLLYLPYGYDSSKKYPVIVDYYETHASEIHIYQVPEWSCALLDIPTFLSHGYIIFRPDVYFTVGEPAKSAYDAVISGIDYLIKEGIADPKRIGLQGHSWSGCTTAQLITMTDVFKCANINAGVVNLIEAYTALRIGTGSTRMFMYEDWQCRMGKSLWEDTDAYIRNSPILYADKITAPVLIMHNDQDDAVEFHEGRNLYLALRRLHKPVWLLNYKGDGHFIDNPAARRDWTLRMMQFFDYYLKDTDIPRWMKEGININERGYQQKYDLVK